MPALNILITSAGGLTGTFLTQHLLKNQLDGYQYRLVAIDCNELVFTKYIAHKFYVVPPTNDPTYENVLDSIIAKEKIHMILPTSSYDIPFYSKKLMNYQKIGVHMLLSSHHTNEVLHNKKKMYQYLTGIGIPVPKLYDNNTEVLYPAIIKKCESSGSTHVKKLENNTDLQYWTSVMNDYVITSFIEGKEYTVDCLFDQNAELIVYYERRRIKSLGGAVIITQNEHTLLVKEMIQLIGKSLHIVGPMNFQYILDKSGNFYFTDFNPRFASGGLPLTVAAGYDVPNMIIQLLLGLPLAPEKITPIEGLTMYRYFNEFFIKENLL